GGAGFAELRLAVNVSAQQFRSPGFVNAVERTLRAASLEPRNLELELTEGVLVESRDRTVAVLRGLKELGVQIAVDDFGMGYSSLSYLSRLPIDRSEEHTSELQSRFDLVCRLLLDKKNYLRGCLFNREYVHDCCAERLLACLRPVARTNCGRRIPLSSAVPQALLCASLRLALV